MRPSRRCARSPSRRHAGSRPCFRRGRRCGWPRSSRAGSALPSWQFALSATDANRFSIRLARDVTGPAEGARLQLVLPRHGRRDLRHARRRHGRRAERATSGRRSLSPRRRRVVEFNDVERLERELEHGDVALVLAEPALTNIGIVHPEPGFHDALRELTRAHGTLLAIDETHTICCGPGGFTARTGSSRTSSRSGSRSRAGSRRRRTASPRSSPTGLRARSSSRTSTSAASAGRWRRTRSRSRRCARRSPRC